MLVHEVMSTGLVTAKKTNTTQIRYGSVGRDENDELSFRSVEGDARLIGMVPLREVLLPLSRALGVSFSRFNNKCYWRLCL
jgi:hypothetical protein